MKAADIACVVLASGLSKRFGAADKLSADLCGESVLSHVLQIAKEVGFGEVFCVTQSNEASKGEGVKWIENENPKAGQGNALRLGLRAVKLSGWGSCAILLGDMPLVRSAYVKELISKRYNNQSIISINETIRMPPAIFNSTAIDLILADNSANGVRDIFDDLDLVTMQLSVSDALDVDTPADLARVAHIMRTRKT